MAREKGLAVDIGAAFSGKEVWEEHGGPCMNLDADNPIKVH
jgi:hypothetical protein